MDVARFRTDRRVFFAGGLEIESHFVGCSNSLACGGSRLTFVYVMEYWRPVWILFTSILIGKPCKSSASQTFILMVEGAGIVPTGD